MDWRQEKSLEIYPFQLLLTQEKGYASQRSTMGATISVIVHRPCSCAAKHAIHHLMDPAKTNSKTAWSYDPNRQLHQWWIHSYFTSWTTGIDAAHVWKCGSAFLIKVLMLYTEEQSKEKSTSGSNAEHTCMNHQPWRKLQQVYKRRALPSSSTQYFLLLPGIFQYTAMAGTSVFDHGFKGYQILDRTETGGEENGSWRTFSRRKRGPYNMVTSLSYRQERAKKRQIFLQSYKLTTIDSTLGGSKNSYKLKRVMIKVKAVVVSIVSISRIGSWKSCNSRSAICASSPTSVAKCFWTSRSVSVFVFLI